MKNNPAETSLPTAIESEQAVLGAILLDDGLFPQVMGRLAADDFHLEKHRRIFLRMGDLYKRGSPIDDMTLMEELQGADQLQSCDGAEYIASLSAMVPQLGNVDAYAKIIKEKSLLRSIVHLGAAMQSEALGRGDANSIVGSMMDKLSGILGTTDAGLLSLRELVGRDLPATLGTRKTEGVVSTGFLDLDAKIGTLKKGDLIVIAARPAMGKAQPLSAKVLRADGKWSTMGDLRVGDHLASSDARPSQVSGIYPQGTKDTYRITLSDGRSTVCCAEHLWRVNYRKWPESKVISTAEIRQLLSEDQYKNRLWMPRASGHWGTIEPLPLHPWVLGVLLGDGHFGATAVKFTNSSKELVAKVSSLLPVGCSISSSGIDHCIIKTKNCKSRNAAVTAIKSLGLFRHRSYEKFIPEIYLSAPRQERLELLRGLLDTDGTPASTGSIEYCTASPRLAEDILSLARSLGCIASVSRKERPTYSYKGEARIGRTAFRVRIKSDDIQELFSTLERRGRCGPPPAARKRLSIASIEPLGRDECQCISVTHPNQLYITDDYIATHNTSWMMNVVEHVASQGQVVAVFSLEMSRTALIQRLLCQVSQLNVFRMMNGSLSQDERRKVNTALNKVIDWPIYIDDKPALTVTQMLSEARRLQMVRGLDLVVMDYLQLVGSGGSGRRYDNRTAEVSEISTGFKNMAKTLNVPIIALSQLNREVEKQKGHKRPMLSHLRESGSIEQDAAVVGFLYRPEVYLTDREDLKGVAELIVAKNRNGPTGTIDLHFEAECTRFSDLAKEYDGYEQA